MSGSPIASHTPGMVAAFIGGFSSLSARTVPIVSIDTKIATNNFIKASFELVSFARTLSEALAKSPVVKTFGGIHERKHLHLASRERESAAEGHSIRSLFCISTNRRSTASITESGVEVPAVNPTVSIPPNHSARRSPAA